MIPAIPLSDVKIDTRTRIEKIIDAYIEALTAAAEKVPSEDYVKLCGNIATDQFKNTFKHQLITKAERDIKKYFYPQPALPPNELALELNELDETENDALRIYDKVQRGDSLRSDEKPFNFYGLDIQDLTDLSLEKKRLEWIQELDANISLTSKQLRWYDKEIHKKKTELEKRRQVVEEKMRRMNEIVSSFKKYNSTANE